MTSPTLKELNEIRKTGFRPSVLCACINEKKILLFFKKEYSMWLLPQGGIDNAETPEDAVYREIKEEIGNTFLKSCEKDPTVIGEDQIEFLPGKQGLDELKTDEGQEIKMLGKKFYFYAVAAKTQEIDISETKYDDYFWFEYPPALFLARKIHQPGKRRITMKVINLLKDLGLTS